MRISNRLSTIAKYVPEGSTVADIGTDHGYLLLHLLDEDRIKKGIACDLNKQPLKYAENNLRAYIDEGRAEIRLGDGLDPVKKDRNIDCIVIAGMGGSLMIEILKNQEDFLKNVSRLILAPNVSWEKVRRFLIENGWNIIAEDLVLEDGKFYPIIISEKGINQKLSEAELFFGPFLIREKHPLLKAFFENEDNKINKKILRMLKSKDPEIMLEIEKIKDEWQEMSGFIHEN